MVELVVGGAKLYDVLRLKVNHAIATAMRVSRSGLADQQVVARARSEEMSLNNYALLQAYVLMAVTGLGYLALTWSTVVLLGGFVTSLGMKDFWCLTGISMVQAARIFNDSGDNLFPIFLNLTQNLVRKVFANPVGGLLQKMNPQHSRGHSIFTVLWVQLVLFIVQILSLPVLIVVLIVGALYVLGPVACIALSVWRLLEHDYGDTTADDSKANLVPALIIFYGLVICQGVLYSLWRLIDVAAMWVVVSLCEECKLPEKWGRIIVVDYLYDTRVKCWRDPTSIDGRNLINYAVNLVDSESQKDYLSGARLLDIFIQLEADVRSLLLPSRARVQKLIDTLGWRSCNRELREVVARIVAYLAGDIHLCQFPGATRCISSLLDTTLPYWNNQLGPNGHSPIGESKTDASDNGKGRLISSVQKILISAVQETSISSVQDVLISAVQEMSISDAKERLIYAVKEIEEYEPESVRYQGRLESKEDCWNELILQGLAILERLAFDQQNCSDICSTPDLLPNIMAPLYSETLIQDIKVSASANVANASLKVVHRLIRAPKWIGKSNLVRDISSSKQALISNLESFLGNSAGKELQMRAIEILTELVVLTEPEEHSLTNLSASTKENLIKKQLQIFLADDEGKEEKLRVTAGKSLALLSKIKTISNLIMKEQDKEDNTVGRRNEILETTKNNIIVRLNEIIDAKNNIRYRTIALEILENLCTHCTLDKDYVKETLLPKVVKEVLATIKRDHPKRQRENKYPSRDMLLENLAETANAIKAIFATKKHEENPAISGPGDDEENQALLGPGDDEEEQCSGQIKSPGQENEGGNAKMEFIEALLSLTFVICDKLITADDFNDVVQKSSIREITFVGTLQAIVKENREARADCLRIVKLCGQIVVLMLQRGQVTARLKLCVESLREASEIMSDLESCMLFAGTDCGVKKTVRPLLSDLVEKARKLLGY